MRADAARAAEQAFLWQNQFLESIVPHKTKGLVSLLEVDETCFREFQIESRKFTRPARFNGGRAKSSGSKAVVACLVLGGLVRGQPYTVYNMLAKLNVVEMTAALENTDKPSEMVVCTNDRWTFLRLHTSLSGRPTTITSDSKCGYSASCTA